MDIRDTAYQRSERQFTVEDDDGVEHELPTKWVVCPTCNGRGNHVNPSVDAHGITAEEFAEDPDFRDDYFAGVYDVTCYECGGRTTVRAVDESRCDKELLKLWREAEESLADMYAMMESERRYGA